MSLRPQDDIDDIDYIDSGDPDSARPGPTRRPRQPRQPPPPPSTSWTDPRFLVPLLLFLTAVFVIGMAIRSNGISSNTDDLLEQENAVIPPSELALSIQQAELRAGFDQLTITEQDGTVIITGSVSDATVAASIGAVARSVEGTQRVDNRVVVAGGVVDTPPSTVTQVIGGSGGLADQLANVGLVTFETGSSSLTAEGLATVDSAAALLNRAVGIRIEVHGHTDSDGDDTANQVLSQERAEAVVTALTQRGVDAARLTAVGFGESDPIAPNITTEGRATNRRIEFVIR